MDLYTVIITMILVLDPFGNIPMFSSVLKNISSKRRKIIVVRELLIALVILTLFLFFGQAMLASLNIEEAALRIAGGVILFLIALKMIFPEGDFGLGSAGHQDSLKGEINDKEPLIVPLAIPFVAGPSALAYVSVIGGQVPEQTFLWFLALLIAWSFSFIVLFLADSLAQKLGTRLIKAIERLMGMILITLAVQMLLEGLREWLLSLG